MYVIRPAREDDLDALHGFATQASLGILSLPKDKHKMEEKIARSVKSFAKDVKEPKDEFYFFVLENTKTKQVGGCSALWATSGIKEPLYFFRHIYEYHRGNEIALLQPVVVTDGPTELCGLFLDHSLRKEGLGILLSLCRMLFIASHPARFKPTLMARIRGFITDDNTTPFWDNVLYPFAQMTFFDAMQKMTEDPEFIPAIFPKHPIYLSHLSKNTLRVIGKPHIRSRPAIAMLKKEGFYKIQDVDFIDAGPILEANREQVQAYEKAFDRRVHTIKKINGHHNEYIIAKGKGKDFKATVGIIERFQEQRQEAIVTQEAADLLDLKTNDLIFTTPAHKRTDV